MPSLASGPPPAAGSLRRAAFAVAAGALLVRVAFVIWAPPSLASDAEFYYGHALALMRGNGYTNADGSPAAMWMPGWAAFMAVLFKVFGPRVFVAQLGNAVLGAATAGFVCALGGRLFSRRIGVVAGVLWAVWPSVVFFTTILFTETLFTALFTAGMLGVVVASQEQERRTRWLVASGVALSAALWVRSEPFGFLPVFALFLAWTGASWKRGALGAALLLVVMAVGIAPWTIRNAVAFGRFIPTAANAGWVFYEGNHVGAPGGNDLLAMFALREKFDHLSIGQGDVECNAEGLRLGLAFVRDHPGETLQIAWRKLVLTYGSDDRAPVLIRGFTGPMKVLPSRHVPLYGYIPENFMTAMQGVANVYWYAMLALVAIGLSGALGWRPESRILVLGGMLTWVAIHAALIGGPRFHQPETTLLAIVAALGVERILVGLRGLHAVLPQPVE